MNERRISDKLIETIMNEIGQLKLMISEIHQRQSELTIPKIEKIENCLYGNGENGLVKEHIICHSKIQRLNNIKNWFMTFSVTMFIAIISFSFGYGQLSKTVDFIKNILEEHIRFH